MGAAPAPGLLTIDPDATWISTYGANKEGSAFSYKHEVGMSDAVGDGPFALGPIRAGLPRPRR